MRSPHIHLSFHGVELIGRLLASKEANNARSQACPCLCTSQRAAAPPKPSGLCHYHHNAPGEEINGLWGSPNHFPDLPRLPKARSSSKDQRPCGKGHPLPDLLAWDLAQSYLELSSGFKELVFFAYTVARRNQTHCRARGSALGLSKTTPAQQAAAPHGFPGMKSLTQALETVI